MPDAVLVEVNPPREIHPLRGSWYNGLGSRLTIEVADQGAFRGTYTNGVGALAGHAYRVSGTYDPAPIGGSLVLAFVVDWTEAHSVTAWSGLFYPDNGVIRAMWLMTTETEPGEEWKSTFVGHDDFCRTPPT